MKAICSALSLCVFLSVVFSSHVLADTNEIQAKLEEALAKAEKQTLADPLGGRHMVFAHAAITAPTGYANILMNIAHDPAVRQVILAEQHNMQDSVRKTWNELGDNAERLYPGSNPQVDWMTLGFYSILENGFFPPDASKNAALFMQSGPTNAYTWTLGPNAPMANIYDELIDKMSGSHDAVIAVLAHELAHNQGLHIWAQVIWGAIADKFGRILIPNPDTIPGDIFSGIPEGITKKFTLEQRAALNREFSGMSRADLDMKLSQRLDHIIEFIRNDLGSRTGEVQNHNPSNPKEIEIRSTLAQIMKKIGNQLYEAKGREHFMLWAAQLAEDVMEVEQNEVRLSGNLTAGAKIDKKVSAFGIRQEEDHADLVALTSMYRVFKGDLERAIKACATADAYLAGGRFANVDAIVTQADEMADLRRTNPKDEAFAYERIHKGMKSHSEPVERAGRYRQFAKTPAFKIVTDPFNRAFWIYSELRRAMDREVKQGQMAGDAFIKSEWEQGEARLQKLLDAYEEPLLKAFTDEAIEISLGNKPAKGSLYSRLFAFIQLYREAQKTDSPKVWGRWDWNISNAIGGPDSFLAELRFTLQKKIAELRQQASKNGKQIERLVKIDNALGRAGISPPNVDLDESFEAGLDAEPGSPESVVATIRPKGLRELPSGGRWPEQSKRSLACGAFLVPPESPFPTK